MKRAQIRSTKSFWKMPVAHCQYFDRDRDGNPGPCAAWHGYDRSFHFEFAGDIDEHGWVVGFGDLKPVRAFLEYYFDHTALAPADDPRLEDILKARDAGLVDLRVLPYGVSMEMSSLFIFEQVNPYIVERTNGRAYVSKIESREHDSNSAWIEVPQAAAILQSDRFFDRYKEPLIKRPIWEWTSPRDALAALNNIE